MIPTLNSLQKLAAEACMNNDHAERSLWNQLDKDDLAKDIEEARVIKSRLSMYHALQKLIQPNSQVYIDGLKGKPEYNNTMGIVLFWKERDERWAVQPEGVNRRPILLRPHNLLPLLSQQTELELKLLASQTAATTQRQAMHVLWSSNQREEAWSIIGSGYRLCPLLIWNRAFEINDITARRPILVKFARALQSPISLHGDRRVASRIRNAMERSEPGYERPNVGNILYIPEDHEKIEQEDKPAAMWFRLFALLDGEEWIDALDCLASIVEDIVSGVWPLCYLTEALYHAALVDFGLGNRDSCKRMNRLYQAFAHPLDRSRYSSELLDLWINKVRPAAFQEALEESSPLSQLKKDLSRTWDSDTFSSNPWVLSKVAEDLGAEQYEGPYNKIGVLIEQEWAKYPGLMPCHVRESLEDTKKPGYPHAVTVRHRKSRSDERKEKEEWERTLYHMYEDRY